MLGTFTVMVMVMVAVSGMVTFTFTVRCTVTVSVMVAKLEKEIEMSTSFLEVGLKYLFRTVTMIYTGQIVDMNENEIKLTSAAWIADTGRWADNLKSCEFEEVEPYHNDVIIYKGALLDVTRIIRLPLKQK
jgi:hypothetical protein